MCHAIARSTDRSGESTYGLTAGAPRGAHAPMNQPLGIWGQLTRPFGVLAPMEDLLSTNAIVCQ